MTPFNRIPAQPLLLSLFVLLVGYLLSPHVCADPAPDSLLQQSLQQRFATINRLYAEAMKIDRAHAKQLIDALDQYFHEHGTEEDQLLLRVCLITKAPEKPELFESEVLSVLKEARRLKNPFMMAKAHHILGLYYFYKQKKYALAFRHMLQMVEMIKDLDNVAYPGHTYAVYFTARSHYDFFDYPNAIRYGQILMKVKAADVKDTHIFNACMMGMAYLKLGKYQQARTYFHWALHFIPFTFKEQKLEGWRGILLGDIGQSYLDEKQYDKAIPYLKQGLLLTQQAGYWDNVARFSSKLALIYLHHQQPQLAQPYALAAFQATQQIKGSLTTRAESVAEPFTVISDCYRALGDYKEAFRFADSAEVAHVQWKKQLDVTIKHQAEIAIEQQKNQAREQALKQGQRRELLVRNGLIILVFVLLISLTAIYYAHQRNSQKRQRQLLAEKHQTETELQHAQALLSQIQQGILQKSQLIEQTEQQLKDHFPDPQQYQLLSELRQSVILTDDDWKQFVALFEKAHPGFFIRLKKQLPDLTPAETRFMALSRLGYSTREMAAMLGVGQGAIRQYRLTVRRKFASQEDVTIEQVATAI